MPTPSEDELPVDLDRFQSLRGRPAPPVKVVVGILKVHHGKCVAIYAGFLSFGFHDNSMSYPRFHPDGGVKHGVHDFLVGFGHLFCFFIGRL
jgi:hypothetical protein